VHAGRPAEALEALRLIALFNGAPALASELALADVDDAVRPPNADTSDTAPVTPMALKPEASLLLPAGLPRWVHRWAARMRMVLTPAWRRTTLLVWGAWCAMALGEFNPSYYHYHHCYLRWAAYTMFNVFLPKLLESTGTKAIEDSLWDVLVFTLGGCPGALVSLRVLFRGIIISRG
jgi:hypothetical protein